MYMYMYIHMHVCTHAVIQAAQAAVCPRGKDHREAREAAEVGAGEKKETKTSGDLHVITIHTCTCTCTCIPSL